MFNIDYVVHLAGPTERHEELKEKEILDTSVHGVKNVLGAALK
jgi:nucleoside-diphosphate-sugar epimerase